MTAGIVFAVLPGVTFAGSDARPMAFTMAAAVWLTVLCVLQSRKDRSGPWWGYGLALVCAGLLNGYLLLLIPAHAVVVKMTAASSRSFKQWMTTVALAVLALIPFQLAAVGEYGLSNWDFGSIGKIIDGVMVAPYFSIFEQSRQVAVVSGIILLVGISVALTSGIRPARGHLQHNHARHGGIVKVGSPRVLVALCLTWIAVPTAGQILAQLVLNHPFRPRHLSFLAPALALLLGLSIVSAMQRFVPRRLVLAGTAAVVTVFAVVAAPGYLAQRELYSRGAIDYRAVTEVLESHAAEGDCLVVDNSPVPGAPWRLGIHKSSRPDVYQKLHEVARRQTLLGIVVLPPTPVAAYSGPEWVDLRTGCSVLWTLSLRDKSLPAHEEGQSLPPGPQTQSTDSYRIPRAMGYRIVERWQFRSSQVTKSVRP